MAPKCSIAGSSNLSSGGVKPGLWPRENVRLRLGIGTGDIHIEGESDSLLWLLALLRMLKLMMIAIKAISAILIGIGSGSDDTANTNRVMAALTNRNLASLDIRVASWVIIALLLHLLLKLESAEHEPVVLSLPFVLWHRWLRLWLWDLLVVFRRKAVSGA